MPRSAILDVAHAIRHGALERWFSVRGIPVTSTTPVGSVSGASETVLDIFQG